MFLARATGPGRIMPAVLYLPAALPLPPLLGLLLALFLVRLSA